MRPRAVCHWLCQCRVRVPLAMPVPSLEFLSRGHLPADHESSASRGLGVGWAPRNSIGPTTISSPRRAAKSSPNRVVVDVLQGRRNGLNRKYIPVETGPLLPKPKARLPRSFQHSQPRQERRALPCQDFLDLLRERLLDSSQIKTDRRIRSPRIGEQMHMFRHENKPDQFRRCLLVSRVNASCQLLPPRVVRQQRHTTIAQKVNSCIWPTS